MAPSGRYWRERRPYVVDRYPLPEGEDQNEWAVQWGQADGCGGHRFETPPVSTHKRRKDAEKAKRALLVKAGLLDE